MMASCVLVGSGMRFYECLRVRGSNYELCLTYVDGMDAKKGFKGPSCPAHGAVRISCLIGPEALSVFR